MQPLYLMKGTPRILLTIENNGIVYKLVIYDDGSYGILRDDKHIGIWEREEQLDCLKMFAGLGGILTPIPNKSGPLAPPTLVVIVKQSFKPCLN